ncbi:unnamed protein product [Chrysoparadoxa australica]
MAAPKHDWSIPDRPGLAIEEEGYNKAAGTAPVLGVQEAEGFAESIRRFRVEEVGSSEWLEQHRRLVKLNLQAHQSAMARSDEFVLEALLTFDKVHDIVHELLLVEAWKEFVLPVLLKQKGLSSGSNNMRLYFMLYHEATVANLLEVLLYHAHCCSEMGDAALELVDYCARKLVLLNSTRKFSKPASKVGDAKAFAKELEQRDPVKELQDQQDDIEFRVCITAVTLLRYLCEHISQLPLSAMTRVLETHDVLLGLVPLIENPPWTVRTEEGKWKKYMDFKWEEVRPADLLKVTQTEAQVWLAVFFITCNSDCRERYAFNSFRKECLLRSRKYINDLLLDQLPVLADVQRYMDELALMEVPEAAQTPSGGLLMQAVPIMREAIIKGKDWGAVADEQMEQIFSHVTDATDTDLRKISQLFCDDSLEDLLAPQDDSQQ